MSRDAGFVPAQRLWTPWRMAYVGGTQAEPGCVFCNALASDDDVTALIVHRGQRAFAIMNLYPYNTGHLMIVPHDHKSEPGALAVETRAEMAELTASFCAGLPFVLGCDGLNAGMNLGSAAGAGIADHLHQHIVPRWTGDANFMPIIGGTKVLPELIPATYAKLRAEVARRKSEANTATALLFDRDRPGIHLAGGEFPTVALVEDEPVWKSLLSILTPQSAHCELLGWAGPPSTAGDATGMPTLAYSFTPRSDRDTPYRFVSFDEARAVLAERQIETLRRAAERVRMDLSKW